MIPHHCKPAVLYRLPLREVVSWNTPCHSYHMSRASLPLREVVSWNVINAVRRSGCANRLPLREVVSWNIAFYHLILLAIMSTSAWGSELKYHRLMISTRTLRLPLREVVSWNISIETGEPVEFCLPLREVVSWNALLNVRQGTFASSTSAWGSELKYLSIMIWVPPLSLPLREVVSWNVSVASSSFVVGVVYHCVR